MRRQRSNVVSQTSRAGGRQDYKVRYEPKKRKPASAAKKDDKEMKVGSSRRGSSSAAIVHELSFRKNGFRGRLLHISDCGPASLLGTLSARRRAPRPHFSRARRSALYIFSVIDPKQRNRQSRRRIPQQSGSPKAHCSVRWPSC